MTSASKIFRLGKRLTLLLASEVEENYSGRLVLTLDMAQGGATSVYLEKKVKLPEYVDRGAAEVIAG